MRDHPAERCFSVRELAARWRTRTERVRRMIRDGILPAILIGDAVRISPEAVASAERGPLAVKPRPRRRVDRISDEVRRLLED